MQANELSFMVVEDDDFQRGVIVGMLRSLGVTEVREADNGKRALDMLHAKNAGPVDIEICDLDMPEMDGLEFLRHLGQENSAASVVILSALDEVLLVSVRKMAQAYGIKLLGVIKKPVTSAQLEALISQYGRSDDKPQQAAATASCFSLEEILQGVRARQFEPFFQPKVELKTGRLIGVEALARWNHPEQGVIGPHAFIPPLERGRKMDELTFLMLEKTAAACRLLHDKGYALFMSVNLSLVSLSDTTLADRITQVMRDAGIDPHYITLEITESAAMTDVASALENLARLRMRGFGLSIDDYGTGYASMQQITRIAFTELKIDRSFVKDFATNHALHIVVRSSIRMAHRLRIKSVAEGVETQQDWDTLKGMGCDTAQGYLIARPMDLAALHEFCSGYSA
ncbi:MAG TPA: EAL domain-containing response regulator [Gallionellaceae bacterium]|nr:EAL domain-containing response regulator [Gallionellaceae bacterium]